MKRGFALGYGLAFSIFTLNMALLAHTSLRKASTGGFLNVVEKCPSPTEAFNSRERERERENYILY
jgi:hypothetical protein